MSFDRFMSQTPRTKHEFFRGNEQSNDMMSREGLAVAGVAA